MKRSKQNCKNNCKKNNKVKCNNNSNINELEVNRINENN